MSIPRASWIVLIVVGVVMGGLPVFGQLAISDPIKAVDNIPPEPVFGILAADTPADQGQSISLRWNLSADDTQGFSSFGGTIVPRSGIHGYRIYRSIADIEDNAEELVATVGPGVDEFIDSTVEKGILYTYAIRPYDADNETDPLIESGSEVDLARIAQALDNTFIQPLGEDGTPIVGWFSGQGNGVGFNDFFLFAENFGRSIDGNDFDPLFDIVVNQRIDFDDFFRFAEDFGKIVSNAAEIQETIGL